MTDAITFIIELVCWLRARKERNLLAGRPYFWGHPSERAGFDRHEAFLRCTGLK